MAIPLAKVSFPFKGHQYKNNFWSKKPITTPNLSSKWTHLGLSWREEPIRKPVTGAVTPSNDYSLVVSEIQTKKKEEDREGRVSITEHERGLVDVWRQIHGQDEWESMLDPMDPLLRSELIRYGEMAQACYDAFDLDPYSKYCGSCHCEPSKFFQYLGLAHCGYEVTRYLHTSYNANLPQLFKKSLWEDSANWSPVANWFGYVAVSDNETSANLGRRDITIAWRGTVTKLDWMADFTDLLRSIMTHKIPAPDPQVKAEAGFIHVYTDRNSSCEFCMYSAREQVLAEVKRLVQKYAGEELSITITGHSLGSALAILNAYDLAETGADLMDDGQAIPICVYSFAGPRVGNTRFKERLECLGVKVLRVVNVHDKVPRVPGMLFNEHMPAIMQKIGDMLPWSYSHVGVELALDHKNSPFLKETNDIYCCHNLEALLHLLDGYHGKGQMFALTSKRSLALVNKSCDFLKDHFLIPPNWRQKENRGLVKDTIGSWMQPERHDLEEHLQLEGMDHHLQQLGLASAK
ncbi:Phospholipase A(1) [Bertholletia excelsa]